MFPPNGAAEVYSDPIIEKALSMDLTSAAVWVLDSHEVSIFGKESRIVGIDSTLLRQIFNLQRVEGF